MSSTLFEHGWKKFPLRGDIAIWIHQNEKIDVSRAIIVESPYSDGNLRLHFSCSKIQFLLKNWKEGAFAHAAGQASGERTHFFYDLNKFSFCDTLTFHCFNVGRCTVTLRGANPDLSLDMSFCLFERMLCLLDSIPCARHSAML